MRPSAPHATQEPWDFRRTGGALPTFENLGRFLRHGSDVMSEAAEGD